MTLNVGINGFGRIGRGVLRAALKRGDLNVVAINDLLPAADNAHLLEYDSVHGILPEKVEHDGSAIVVNGKKIKITAERDPGQIKWKDLGVDIAANAKANIKKIKARKDDIVNASVKNISGFFEHEKNARGPGGLGAGCP